MFRKVITTLWCPYSELWSYVNPFVPNAPFLSTHWKQQKTLRISDFLGDRERVH